MAEAKLKEETTVKVVGVTLELTYEEAQYLRALLFRHVAGYGNMRIALTGEIDGALADAGVKPAPLGSYAIDQNCETSAVVFLDGGNL